MRVCDFIIFEIPILTVEMIYIVDHTLSYCQNRDLKYNKITNSRRCVCVCVCVYVCIYCIGDRA